MICDVLQIPSESMAQRATWSSYKHRNTIKHLVLNSAAGVLMSRQDTSAQVLTSNYFQLVDVCLHFAVEKI